MQEITWEIYGFFYSLGEISIRCSAAVFNLMAEVLFPTCIPIYVHFDGKKIN
jgi:hypothetical protein